MSGPRFLLSGALILACLTAFVVAITTSQASGSAAPSTRTPTSAATTSIGSSTDLPPWLAPAGIAVMLAGIVVVGTARRRTSTFA